MSPLCITVGCVARSCLPVCVTVDFSRQSPLSVRFSRQKYWLCLVAQSCPALCHPMDYSRPGSSLHGDSPGKNTGVGCHALPQGIFPTQGLNPSLLHCRQSLYHRGKYPLASRKALYVLREHTKSLIK